MGSDANIIIAFLYKRSGKEELSFSELYLILSMELNWFTPDDAKTFVNMAIKQKLLIKKGELIKPNFDFRKIVVPVGFVPIISQLVLSLTNRMLLTSVAEAPLISL